MLKVHVTFLLGKYALETATNILRIRNPILTLARVRGEKDKFLLLKEYHDGCKTAGF